MKSYQGNRVLATELSLSFATKFAEIGKNIDATLVFLKVASSPDYRITVKELRQCFKLPLATMSRIKSHLERKGLLNFEVEGKGHVAVISEKGMVFIRELEENYLKMCSKESHFMHGEDGRLYFIKV